MIGQPASSHESKVNAERPAVSESQSQLVIDLFQVNFVAKSILVDVAANHGSGCLQFRRTVPTALARRPNQTVRMMVRGPVVAAASMILSDE